jgi:hypothetical protein
LTGAVALLVGAELRRRWRSHLAIALLVGVIGGVVLTLVAGARRTDGALNRLRASTLDGDASVEVSPEYFDAIEALPEVAVAAPGSFFFVMPAEAELDDLITIASPDGRFGTVVNRPRLLAGRLPSADQAHEVGVNTVAARRLGVGPGDRIKLVSLTPEQMEQLIASGDPGEPAGPTIDVVVAGTGLAADDLASDVPIIILTPAFYTKYRDQVGHFDDILDVRLVRGEADMASFRGGVERLVPDREGVIVETDAETIAEIEDTTNVQATALGVFALAAALAGFVAIGQAVVRRLAPSYADQPALWALGLDRRSRSAALLAPFVLVASGGAALAVVLAAVASPLMPTGYARRVEPNTGLDFDWVVLGLGCIAIALAVTARAALSAWSASRRLRDTSARAESASVVGKLVRLGAQPPVVAGVRMALEPGRGRTSVPVRPALVGAVVGVTGVVAALAFSASMTWVVSEASAYGWTWDTAVVGPREPDKLATDVATLARNHDAEGVAALGVLPVRLGGAPIQSYWLDSTKGSGFATVLEGRLPAAADEVLVGSDTLDRLDRDLGDTLTAEGLEASHPMAVTIVGRGVFPEFVHPAVPDSDTGAYNEFALFTRSAMGTIIFDAGNEYFSYVLVRWATGVDVATAETALVDDGFEVTSLGLPPNLQNLERVNAVPLLVGAFLALLASIAIGHALVTAVRTRARDLAVLQTLGFVGSQIRATVASQATTMAVVGLGLGIPFGLVAGRLTWAIVARGLGVDEQVSVPWLAVVAAIPVALLLVNMIAAFPARVAARTRPAGALRAE